MKKTFAVRGMHCASCGQRIEKTFSEIEGVESAVVNFAAEKVTVKFNEKKVEVEKLAKAVKDVGYELVVSKTIPDRRYDSGPGSGERITP